MRMGICTSLYAYRDFSVTHRMHAGNVSIWDIRSSIPMHNFAYRDCCMHMGIPVCKRAGIAKIFAHGDPITHNEVVRRD
jgi:hypothetical protein